eukprot:6195756-Pleurochrysis_carterae.AAC.1
MRDHGKSRQVRIQPDACAFACQSGLAIPFNVVWHSQRSAELLVITSDAGQEIFKCPEPVPAQTAKSRLQQMNPCVYDRSQTVNYVTYESGISCCS